MISLIIGSASALMQVSAGGGVSGTRRVNKLERSRLTPGTLPHPPYAVNHQPSPVLFTARKARILVR